MKLFLPVFLAFTAFAEECEVCVNMLTKIDKACIDEGITSLDGIEKKAREMCKAARDQDNRFCYYVGLTADAATTMHKDIVKPISFHKPAAKICQTLKKKDMQICELKYPKPYDYSAINFKKIKVKELKKILVDWGEVCKNCLEKDEFVKKVKEMMPKYVPKENWPADMKDEL